MKALALAFAAASCLIALPVNASSPPATPKSTYVLTDGRMTVAGPFPSYYACTQRLAALQKLPNESLFCVSNWIRH